MGAQDIIGVINGGPIQRERLLKLDTPLGENVLLPQRVVGHARLGRHFEFTLDAVSTSDAIELKKLIAQPITLWMQQSDKTYLPHHGYVHTARRLGSDSGLTTYQFAFASWMHFLKFRKDARIWQDKSADAILADVFNQHPQAQGAFRFALQNPLPSRSFCVQYEDDWNFCLRLMESEGLYGWFEQAQDGKSHTLVVTDNLSSLNALSPQSVQFYRAGTGSETDALVQWSGTRTLQSTTLTTRTFDYKAPSAAGNPKGTSVPTLATQGDLPQQAEVYEYTGAYSYNDQQRGDHLTQIRMEEWESRAKRFHGAGALRGADAGRWFELADHPEHDQDSAQNRQFAIIEAAWFIENNLPVSAQQPLFPHSLQAQLASVRAAHAHASDVLTAPHTDGSEGFFLVEIEAQRKAVAYRSPLEHHKPKMRMQTAIVVGPENEEVHTDSLNRIKVRFHWDRLNAGDEKASCWVRVAMSDTGGGYGGVHVPRVGEEVMVDWLDGDCDRPIVTGRAYNGSTSPQWHSNGLLSGYRSKEHQGSGYNQMVMDDATGQNRVQLYSSSSNAALHLGYLIAQDGNSRGAYLGSGFDLKSDAYGAVRAGQGLYVSTYAKSAASQQLDVSETQSQLVNAESVIEAMSQASVAHQAEDLTPGHDALKSFTDATQNSVSGAAASGGNTAGGGTGNANAFKQPVIAMGSPAGIALSTQQSVHVAATEHINLVSGQSTHLAAGKSLIASVGDKISLFVQNAGMKLFAAKGKVEVTAQSDNLEVTAQKTIKLLSATDNIEAAADQGILLTSGGAYIRISGGNIEIHAPGNIDIKGAQHSFAGPASQGYPLPAARPDQPGQLDLLHQYANGEAVKGGKFSVLDANGGVLRQGALDASGRTTVSGLPPGVAQVKFDVDPRDPSQPANYFKSMKWPADPSTPSSGDAAAASQMASLLPAAGNAGSAAGAASALGGVAGNASQLAGLAKAATQGGGALASAASGQAESLAQGALMKALPSAAGNALSQANQLSGAAKAVSSIAQSARSGLPALKGLV
ncbi:type VI secretion system tip protein VgrG [Trinickia terrae]|uniref:Type VI secretion system tip protein VgrG n=1 Tax=Trinickia terrae TaxID=2571161 RepID=A0A4U1I7I2_9BURK|nr:type VI secretion system Vgr family protein [Trinickia terrae]TKC89205.1 type VI secretion system tip protein VgrG [Trinickia terrae]